MYFLLIVVVIATIPCGLHGAIEGDEISDLPGLSFLPKFKQYSGYLKATGTRHLHYWFVESAGDPSHDPLVLWMNGGPGCSSMDGLLQEHGPFIVSADGKTLAENPHSWNKVANMLYLEAPAGVGYSYADDKNYTTGDHQVATDNYWALKFFQKNFPEMMQQEFFITGESYGGIYVPTLSVKVAEDKTFNFKGFAVGNGLLDRIMNDNSIIYFGNYHGLWGESLWTKLVKSCCVDGNSSDCAFATSKLSDCQNAVNEAVAVMWQSLNVYNLYAECYKPSTQKHARIHPLQKYMFMDNPVIQRHVQYLKMVNSANDSGITEGSDPPCIDTRGITTYMNKMEVRKSLHIASDLPTWSICSDAVGQHYRTEYNSVRDCFLQLLNTGKFRILVYNGDVDMACNFLGCQRFTESLGQKVTVGRKEWYYTATDGTRQVAGFVKQFNHLTFATVKGAGHMVPQNKPIPALEMFTNFIKGKPF